MVHFSSCLYALRRRLAQRNDYDLGCWRFAPCFALCGSSAWEFKEVALLVRTYPWGAGVVSQGLSMGTDDVKALFKAAKAQRGGGSSLVSFGCLLMVPVLDVPVIAPNAPVIISLWLDSPRNS